MALRGAPRRQVVSGRAGAALAGRQRAVQRRQAAAGVQQRRLLGDLPEQRRPLLTADRHHQTNAGVPQGPEPGPLQFTPKESGGNANCCCVRDYSDDIKESHHRLFSSVW